MSITPFRRLALLAVAPLLASASGTTADAARLQPPRGRSFGFTAQQDPEVLNVPYDGRFTFARIRFTTGPGGYYYMGLPAWAHGYPRAEDNLTRIIKEISDLRPYADGPTVRTNVLAADDPELCKYPVAYLTEAGYWVLTDKEAEALGAYMKKGGFVIFDDFRPPPRGGGGWETFVANMARVLPDARLVDLDPSLPIFHSFFDITSFDILPQYYDAGRPVLRGIYEDNDPRKRLMAVVNFNTDVANFWEFSADGATPVDESNQAYKLGVNYVWYGLTH